MDGMFSEDTFPIRDPNFERVPTAEEPPPERSSLPFWLCLGLAGPTAWSGCFGVVMLLRQESAVVPFAIAVGLAAALGGILGIIAIKSDRK